MMPTTKGRKTMNTQAKTQTREELLREIASLDQYMVACEQNQQGINSKECVWMREWMLPIIKEQVSAVFELNDLVYSHTAKSIMHRTFDSVYPGFRDMFRSK